MPKYVAHVKDSFPLFRLQLLSFNTKMFRFKLSIYKLSYQCVLFNVKEDGINWEVYNSNQNIVSKDREIKAILQMY